MHSHVHSHFIVIPSHSFFLMLCEKKIAQLHLIISFSIFFQPAYTKQNEKKKYLQITTKNPLRILCPHKRSSY